MAWLLLLLTNDKQEMVLGEVSMRFYHADAKKREVSATEKERGCGGGGGIKIGQIVENAPHFFFGKK